MIITACALINIISTAICTHYRISSTFIAGSSNITKMFSCSIASITLNTALLVWYPFIISFASAAIGWTWTLVAIGSTWWANTVIIQIIRLHASWAGRSTTTSLTICRTIFTISVIFIKEFSSSTNTCSIIQNDFICKNFWWILILNTLFLRWNPHIVGVANSAITSTCALCAISHTLSAIRIACTVIISIYTCQTRGPAWSTGCTRCCASITATITVFKEIINNAFSINNKLFTSNKSE